MGTKLPLAIQKPEGQAEATVCRSRECRRRKFERAKRGENFRVLLNIPLLNEPLSYSDRINNAEKSCDLVMDYQQSTLYKSINGYRKRKGENAHIKNDIGRKYGTGSILSLQGEDL